MAGGLPSSVTCRCSKQINVGRMLFAIVGTALVLTSCQMIDVLPDEMLNVTKADPPGTDMGRREQRPDPPTPPEGQHDEGIPSVRGPEPTPHHEHTVALPNGAKKPSWKIEDEQKWWKPHVPELATAWTRPGRGAASTTAKNDDRTTWCHPVLKQEQQKDTLKGLVYIKVPKTSSSALRGVNQAIALHVGQELHDAGFIMTMDDRKEAIACEHFDSHESSQLMDWEDEYQDASLFWTFVRNPVSRDLSELYHFEVTREEVDPYSSEALDSFRNLQNTQIEYMSMEDGSHIDKRRSEMNREDFLSYLKNRIKADIMQKYNFIGILERRAESFAVMSLLWDVDPTDFIVLSAKQANGENYDDGAYDRTCFLMKPSPKSPDDSPPKLRNYIQSKNYTESQADFLLYDAVNASLDQTITAIGAERVQTRKAWIEKLQAIAEEHCSDQAIYPCSKDGQRQPESKQSCYVHDAGCGYACVDQVMQQYRGKLPEIAHRYS
eukprot:CAMPEP_0176027964 /NCGR_PEP_ID=MMETSP0120_2-20121206/13719_1 /TAXON_ID=160619 /ORGANISM="Kryptoperidinium foliaceum, Strain CCMP 1326" /LENGTH=492 /DNA_ID=CAMNT_0017361171 /DNA_START=153 /DNA_END=1631 /DNA_ORIENTATION=-